MSWRTRRSMMGIMVMVCGVLLTSCIPNTNTQAVTGVSIPTPDANRDEAVVCVYRGWAFVNGGVVFDVMVDQQKIGALPVRSWTYTMLPSGQHQLHVTLGGTRMSKPITFHVSKGETQYFQLRTPGGPCVLTQVPAHRGRGAIQGMNFTTVSP